MSADTAPHVPEHRIVQIIADRSARATEYAHLDHCGRCRTALTELQVDLGRFRQQATLAAPSPAKRFVLPADRPERHTIRRWRFGWALAGTVLSLALLVLFLRTGDGWHLPGLSSPTPPITQWSDPEMTQVNQLAENPLPETYLALSESLDEGYEEGFIDFLIPPLNDDPAS